jgi:hypothetical protein
MRWILGVLAVSGAALAQAPPPQGSADAAPPAEAPDAGVLEALPPPEPETQPVVVPSDAGAALSPSPPIFQAPEATPVVSPAAPSPGPLAEPRNRMSTVIGGYHGQFRDDVLAPLRWSGPGLMLRFGYDRAVDRTHQKAWLEGDLSPWLSNRYGHGAGNVALRFGYGFLFRVLSLPRGSRLLVGAAARVDFDIQSYHDWDEERLYWLTTISLAPMVRWDQPLAAGQHLAAELMVPVVAGVSREPEHRYDKGDHVSRWRAWLPTVQKDMHLSSLDKLQAVEARLVYGHRLGRRVDLEGAYTFRYVRYADPLPFQTMTHTLSAGVVVKF